MQIQIVSKGEGARLEFPPFSTPFVVCWPSTPDPPLREVEMKYTRTQDAIRFSTRLDEVRIEKVGTAIKVFLDGADREAVYVFSPSNAEAVATEIGVEAKDEFLDFVETAIEAERAEELVRAVIQKSTTEFFWMNMDQIDRYLIAGEKPAPLSDN